jgi:CRISPR-associated protein Cmr5
MNKRKVDELIPQAYQVLRDVRIADEQGKVDGKWRGQISSFGASIAQGSLLAAVSFFSAQGGADVDRSKLMEAIKRLLKKEQPLFKYVEGTDKRKAKEEILNAAVALKLAMNLYELGKGGKNDADS